MSSDDDDIPLGQRNPAFLLGKSKPIIMSSDDDSPLPSWLEKHKSPFKGETIDLLGSDSDSDVKEVISPIKLLSSQPKQSSQPASQPALAEGGAGPSSSSLPQPKPAAAITKKKAPTPKKPTPGKKKQAPGGDDIAGPSQLPSQSQPAAPPVPRGVPTGLPVPSSTIPVMIPERLSNLKVLLELESTDEIHGATDLSGDSGAIGRILVAPPQQPGGHKQLQIDLKGVLYNATVVPCPVTMAVVNIGQSEAKVESLFSEFVQLREDARFAEELGVGSFASFFGGDDAGGGDDDEHYEGEDGEGGEKKKKKGRAGGGAAAGKRATTAARKPRGGGVKKGASSRGKGKGKAAGKKK